MKPRSAAKHRQRGSALLVALFLLIVVAGLGAMAIRIGATQQQVSNLTLIEARANAAAYSALEYGTYMIKNGGAANCTTLPVPIPATAGALNGYAVVLRCTRLATDAGDVYDLTGSATHSVYGNPDFVQRSRSRRVSNISPGSW
jgi:MSHA biogenesis protein MshP